MKRVFIIGNGPSRKAIDLESLRPHGIIWGCNALYRDFAPDYLLVIDKKMQQEVINAKYHENHKVLFKETGKSPHIPEHTNIYKFNNRISSPNNSGVASIYFALKRGFREIYLIGFDFENPNKNTEQQNVYAGTPNYDRHGTRPPKLPKNVTDKLAYWAEKNSDKVKFVRVIDPESCRIPTDKGFSKDHMEHITYEEFKERFRIR